MNWFKSKKSVIPWKALENNAQLDAMDDISAERPVVIFKNSPICSISAMAADRLNRAWKPENESRVEIFQNDVIHARGIAQKIAGKYDVYHESPQVLVIRNGKCVYSASHHMINYDELMKKVERVV